MNRDGNSPAFPRRRLVLSCLVWSGQVSPRLASPHVFCSSLVLSLLLVPRIVLSRLASPRLGLASPCHFLERLARVVDWLKKRTLAPYQMKSKDEPKSLSNWYSPGAGTTFLLRTSRVPVPNLNDAPCGVRELTCFPKA
jgi:hypothetical protein